MEKILVVGSNSFSGASFVAHALETGAEVIGVSRSQEPSRVFLPYRWIPSEAQQRFKFYPIDINLHLDVLMGILDQFRPRYVVNFAAQSMVAESWQNPDHWMMTNVVSTVRLHERLRHCDFIEKYVHISTPEVYGCCSGLVPENTHYNPQHALCRFPRGGRYEPCDLLQELQIPSLLYTCVQCFWPGTAIVSYHPARDPVLFNRAKVAASWWRTFGQILHPHKRCR